MSKSVNILFIHSLSNGHIHSFKLAYLEYL